ncbi:MAG: S41 family peptidase, partial [Halieaceae bacterium]|nr:S41 family peptidase [Halieaceae bacterium]
MESGFNRTLHRHALAVAVVAVSSAALPTTAASDTWYRQPAMSPDGKHILFAAHGDLWRVSADGGAATPLTIDSSWEGYPVWSRDGKRIAFASDRFGDLDVFVMNADGSDLKRLTHHDANDYPSDFSPDGAKVLFSSARQDSVDSSYFPTGALPELYEVAVSGGTPSMVFTNPAREARYSEDGQHIFYREEKSYENEWRQRDLNAFARDIWHYNIRTGEHQQLTENPGGDHSPVPGRNDTLYLLSEYEGSTFNVRKLSLKDGSSEMLSEHELYPARELSASLDGTLVYSLHGELFTLTPGASPQLLDIRLQAPRLRGTSAPLSASAAISEFAVSPEGDEIAFVSRGEIFVTDTEFGTTVRVTNTPEQERSVSFSPDGRTLLYAAEYDQGWEIHESTITDSNEPRFSAATAFTSKRVYGVQDGTAFQPAYSPNGEMIAFIENRDEVRVIDRDGSNPRTIFSNQYNYSYADGDITFSWSPDSEWLSADYAPRGYWFYKDIGVARVDGDTAPRDISINGYHDGQPTWHASGDVVIWRTDRFGERSHGSWGAEEDVVAAFLTESGWLKYNLDKQEFSLLESLGGEEEEQSDEKSDEEKNEKSDETKVDVNALLNLPEPRAEDAPISIDFDDIEKRVVRLTDHSADLAGAALTSDLSALYYLARTEGGYDLWRRKLRDDETQRVAKLNADSAELKLVNDDKGIVILADGQLMHSELGDSIDLTPVKVSGEMALQSDAERHYLFEHVWRQVEDKFYDPGYHDLDWQQLRDAYESKVAAVSNNRDFATLMSELLGQLNASHTGMYYRGGGGSDADATASLGAIFTTDEKPGLIIAELLPDGPLDRERLDVKVGDRLVAINGTTIENSVNAWQLLNRQANELLRVTLERDGKPMSPLRIRAWSRDKEQSALYDRWIERRRAIVEERSDGRIGYFHIRSMSDSGFRQAFSELFGRNFDKEAVIVDTRFNGGGWLHDDLLKLLDGRRYFNMGHRGRIVRGAPEESWTRPSAVVMNEGNYSNAHMFPYAYKLFEIGPLVGMPVPGTATAVWWETQMTGDLVFGIPQMPILDQ